MGLWRNVSSDARFVMYGCARQMVAPNGDLLVDPAADAAYADQLTIWSPVDPVAEAARAEFLAGVDAALELGVMAGGPPPQIIRVLPDDEPDPEPEQPAADEQEEHE